MLSFPPRIRFVHDLLFQQPFDLLNDQPDNRKSTVFHSETVVEDEHC